VPANAVAASVQLEYSTPAATVNIYADRIIVGEDPDHIEGASVTTTLSADLRGLDMTTGATNRTINLPPAGDVPDQVFYLKKADSGTGTVTIDPDASETIDGASTYILRAENEAAIIQSDGTGWLVKGSHKPPDSNHARYTAPGVVPQALTRDADNVIDFDTIAYDPLSMVTTGASWVFQATVAGIYRVTAAVRAGTATLGSDVARLEVWKSGSLYSRLDLGEPASVDGYYNLFGTDDVDMTDSDTIHISVYPVNTNVTLDTTPEACYVAICKIA